MMEIFSVVITEVKNIESRELVDNENHSKQIEKKVTKLEKMGSGTYGKLARQFSTSFAISKYDVGPTLVVKHKIDTHGEPISQNPRRQPMHLKSKIDESIQDLLKSEIIRECKSP